MDAKINIVALNRAQMHLEDAEEKLESLRVSKETRHSQIVREQIGDVRGCVRMALSNLAEIFEEKK